MPSNSFEFAILNIDKPSGPTSFDISDFVRKKLNEAGIEIRKTSHFGTLDPKVTGVLPVALNRACKLTGFFLGEDKEYVGVMRIHGEKEMKEIQEIINKKFLGKIKQTPPVKSRVKRQEREREIKKFELLEQSDDKKDILFKCEVQGGTYVRKLIDDLGKELNIGGHMLELRRIRAGVFKEDDKNYPAINLYELEKAVKEYKEGKEKSLMEILIPAESVITKLYPIVQVKRESVDKLLHGSPLFEEYLTKKENKETGKLVCIFYDKNFVGVYKTINEGRIFAKPEFVLQPI